MLLGLTPHGRRIRVLHFEPIGRAAGTVGRILALRDDAFKTHLAGVRRWRGRGSMPFRAARSVRHDDRGTFRGTPSRRPGHAHEARKPDGYWLSGTFCSRAYKV